MEEDSRLSRRNRKRVLQQPEQRSTDLTVLQPGVCEGAPTLSVELLVELVRALIQNNPNPDLIMLSVVHAMDVTGATKEEGELLMKALTDEAAKSPWPKGFF